MGPIDEGAQWEAARMELRALRGRGVHSEDIGTPRLLLLCCLFLPEVYHDQE